MGDARRRRVKLDDDELDAIEHDVASATTSQVAALVAEVRRLRAENAELRGRLDAVRDLYDESERR